VGMEIRYMGTEIKTWSNLISCIPSIHLIARWLVFVNLSKTDGSAQACCLQRKILHEYTDVSLELPNGNRNGRKLGISRRKKMGMGFKFLMGMGMKSLTWPTDITFCWHQSSAGATC